MKRFFAVWLLILSVTGILAQAPEKMSYQAVVRNSSDQLVTNHMIGIQISILQGSPAGTVVYTEIQTPTTNANGLVSIEIGGGASFSSINWADEPYFLKTEIDPDGDTNYTIIGTSQLLSVPYAFRAKAAETADDAVKLTGDQTIAGNKTFTGITTVPAPVNLTDAATKAYVDALLTRIQQLENQQGIIKDCDGNIYTTIKIGDQVWMGENLKTTSYKDGSTIPLVTDNTAWGNLSAPGYCWYNNDAPTYKAVYGALYNWYTINTGKLCPGGWHVPTDAEWTSLTTYLGGENVAGGKLKEAGTVHWVSPNTGATNETGFAALPGGLRDFDISGGFADIGTGGQWWSATESSTSDAWWRWVDWESSKVTRTNNNKKCGFSVRCVMD